MTRKPLAVAWTRKARLSLANVVLNCECRTDLRCGLNFAALVCHGMRHAELSRTSRALAPFPRRQASTPHAHLRARGAGAAAVVAAVGCNRRGEKTVKARDSR